MKRPLKGLKPSFKTGDIKRDLTTEQLAEIGAITLAYNQVENHIDWMLTQSLRIPVTLHFDLVTRINGIDGKIHLLKQGTKHLLPEPQREALADCLGEGAFKLLKGYRDAVMHARVHDALKGIGHGIERRGKQHEVLLTPTALRGLYDHLNAVAKEMSALRALVSCTIVQSTLNASDDQERELFAIERQEYLTLCQQHRTERLSLPPLPEFPPEPGGQ
ncbi:MAG TPA: hypothetical protein VGU24_16215 [Microvirga sp.]|jgi:hypothetical protein|nr:hypothetical protein [Microvirga sp.]